MVVVATIPFYTSAAAAEFAYVGAPALDMRGILHSSCMMAAVRTYVQQVYAWMPSLGPNV